MSLAEGMKEEKLLKMIRFRKGIFDFLSDSLKTFLEMMNL